jgi:sec-independent protein translocase protein TatA
MFRNPTTDLIIALVIVLLIFGPKRLPMLGRTLGQGLREFKDSITGNSKSEEEEAAARPELTAATPTPATPTPTPAADMAPASGPEQRSAEVGSSERRP